jgi:hypothetical protein
MGFFSRPKFPRFGGQPAAPAVSPAVSSNLMQAVTSASNAASKFANSAAYRTALKNATSNASKAAGVVGVKAMNSLANKIAYQSANLTQKVNQAAQNPTPGNLSQIPVAAAGLQGAVRQANVTVTQSNANAAASPPPLPPRKPLPPLPNLINLSNTSTVKVNGANATVRKANNGTWVLNNKTLAGKYNVNVGANGKPMGVRAKANSGPATPPRRMSRFGTRAFVN